MRTIITLILVLSSLTGCAALGAVAPNQGGNTSSVDASAPAFPAESAAPSAPDQNMGPRLVIPATGGAPVFAIPLGGDIYLPVTGEAAVIGMPISP